MKKFIKRIPSKLENVIPFVNEALREMKAFCPLEDIFPIKLSLEEALTNAIRHGNKSDPALYVDVEIEFFDDKIVMKVVDHGGGFDAARVADPTSKGNEHKPGGRGVYLIKSLMDEAQYFDGGRGIKMVKLLRKKP